MVAVDQVKLWLIERGVGHAVASRSDWIITACNSMVLGGEPTEGRPKRICRRCRESLASATLIREGD